MKPSNFVRPLLILAIVSIGPLVFGQTAEVIKKREAEIIAEMESISKQLGVSCEQCHKISDYKDSSKKEFHESKSHMKILQSLRESGFDGLRGPEATCYMCHRGKLMPDYKAPKEP